MSRTSQVMLLPSHPHRCEQPAAVLVLVTRATVVVLVGATCRITPVIALVRAAPARQLDLELAAVLRCVVQRLIGFQPTHIAAGVACVGAKRGGDEK